jgi:hypothetical protein
MIIYRDGVFFYEVVAMEERHLTWMLNSNIVPETEHMKRKLSGEHCEEYAYTLSGHSVGKDCTHVILVNEKLIPVSLSEIQDKVILHEEVA